VVGGAAAGGSDTAEDVIEQANRASGSNGEMGGNN